MERQEQKIIKRIKQGQLAEFAKLYDLYIQRIYNFVYYRIQHKETTEDITSQVFMKALEKIDSFDESQAKFSTWLYAVARNSVIDHYRTNKQIDRIEDTWSLSSDSDTERDAIDRATLARVDKHLATLSVEQREIVMLRVWDGLPYKEIAVLVGKTEASCKMAFSRVAVKLRQELLLLLAYVVCSFSDLLN